MFLGWLFLAFVAVSLIAVFLLTPSSQDMGNTASAAGLNDFTFPTNSNDRVIPEIYGTVELYGNVLWYGDFRSETVTKG